MPLVALDRVSVAFGHLPLLDEIAFQVDAGERIAIIGRNGTGKSTLLQILSGDLQPDSGLVLRQPPENSEQGRCCAASEKPRPERIAAAREGAE